MLFFCRLSVSLCASNGPRYKAAFFCSPLYEEHLYDSCTIAQDCSNICNSIEECRYQLQVVFFLSFYWLHIAKPDLTAKFVDGVLKTNNKLKYPVLFLFDDTLIQWQPMSFLLVMLGCQLQMALKRKCQKHQNSPVTFASLAFLWCFGWKKR